jgi:hypothetical protein
MFRACAIDIYLPLPFEDFSIENFFAYRAEAFCLFQKDNITHHRFEDN